MRSKVVKVNGTFQHRKCICMSMSVEPFPNLTCPMCAQIPRHKDFRIKMRREDHAFVKRGHKSTIGGVRLGYLSAHGVFEHNRELSKEYGLEKQFVQF